MTEGPINNKEPATTKFRYRGSSMHSTFKPGETLYLHPEGRPIQPGDVIVYWKNNIYCVHRVTSVESDGIHTHGDDNLLRDDEPVSPKELIGVVAQSEDWGKLHPVRGGRKALRQAQVRWYLKQKFQESLPWLGAPYRWLKARRWVPMFWHPPIIRVEVNTGSGNCIKYLVKGKTVATWYPSTRRFLCRKPYDLVIFPPCDF